MKKEASIMNKKWIAGSLCVMLLLGILGVAMAERLQYGDSGPKVMVLQQRLTLLSFYDGVLDGKYGYKTYQAVKKFQESAGLQADGIAGPKTLEKLGYADPGLSGEIYKLGDSVAKISEIQGRLNALGYMTGSETGVFDDDTQKAVLAFQKTNGLPENGVIDGMALMQMESVTALGKSIENWKAGFSILRLQVHDFYDSVAEVQELLFKLDYVDITDGYYRESTRDAVKLFQQKNGLPPDGEVGPATYNMLVNPAAKKKSDPTPPGGSGAIKLLYNKSEGPLVITLQNVLTMLDYYTGPINGKYDYATYVAVKEFQQYNGLKVDGVVGPKTWEKVNSPTAIKKP
jgi:peptidoglycan hydrolase-like protein with peptidoglycan-binding domain